MKPKVPKAAALPDPEAIPEKSEEAGESEVKRVRRQQGYQKQILTGSLKPTTGGKTVLG